MPLLLATACGDDPTQPDVLLDEHTNLATPRFGGLRQRRQNLTGIETDLDVDRGR